MSKDNRLPSDDVMRLYALKEIENKKVARACANCTKYDKGNGKCTITKKMMSSYMTCPSHEYETEQIANVALNDLKNQQLEADKFENLLALAITTANTTTCFLEDLESRLKKMYKAECDKGNRKLLRRDLDMTESMENAFKDIQMFLEKIDQRYRFYVQPYLMKWFSSNGQINASQMDGHLNNSMEFGRLLMMFTRKCIGNEANCKAVFGLLDYMTNDYPYALDEKDAEHYKLKGFNE